MSDHQQSFFDNSVLDDDDEANKPIDLSAVDLYRQLARVGQEKLRLGKSISREETKAIRELALLESVETCWPDRSACAEALGLTPKQVEKRAAEGMPAPGHSPIPKEPVYQWYISVLRSTKGGSIGAEADLATQEKREAIRGRRLKNDKLEGTLKAEAETQAMDTIAEVIRTLKSMLLFAVPVHIRDALAKASAHEIEIVIRAEIAKALTSAAELAGIQDPAALEPHSEQTSTTETEPS